MYQAVAVYIIERLSSVLSQLLNQVRQLVD